jgi:hypothetical protein
MHSKKRYVDSRSRLCISWGNKHHTPIDTIYVQILVSMAVHSYVCTTGLFVGTYVDVI